MAKVKRDVWEKVYGRVARKCRSKPHGYRNFVKFFAKLHKHEGGKTTDLFRSAAREWRRMPRREKLRFICKVPGSDECICSLSNKVRPITVTIMPRIHWQRITNVLLIGVIVLFILLAKR